MRSHDELLSKTRRRCPLALDMKAANEASGKADDASKLWNEVSDLPGGGYSRAFARPERRISVEGIVVVYVIVECVS